MLRAQIHKRREALGSDDLQSWLEGGKKGPLSFHLSRGNNGGAACPLPGPITLPRQLQKHMDVTLMSPSPSVMA